MAATAIILRRCNEGPHHRQQAKNMEKTQTAPTTIHPSAIVDEGAQIGEGTKVWHWTHVSSGAVLGERCSLGQNVYVGNRVVLGNNVSRKHEYRNTLVRKGASIGANATVVCGTTIGRYAFIGAGAVVSRNVPDHALMVGVPARRTGWVCQCGVKLPNLSHGQDSAIVHCPECHTGYNITPHACEPTQPEA